MEKLPAALETCALNSPHSVPASKLAKQIYLWESFLKVKKDNDGSSNNTSNKKSKGHHQWTTDKGKRIALGVEAAPIPLRRRTATVATTT
jgi:hypothetical protein